MNPAILKPILAGAAGFILAFVCCGALANRANPQPIAHPSDAFIEVKTPAASAKILHEEVVDTFAHAASIDSITDLLTTVEQSAHLSPADLEAALEKALDLPGDTRSTVLSILLSQWATTQPASAAAWCQERLTGLDRETAFKDVGNTWVKDDPHAFADWTVANLPIAELVRFSPAGPLSILGDHAPLAFAAFLDSPKLHCRSSGGKNFEAHLRDPASLPGFAAAVSGNVAYTDDPKILVQNASDRHQPGKSGWNALFEQVAVAWHRHSPEACESWLSTFPENAQTAARHRIAKDIR